MRDPRESSILRAARHWFGDPSGRVDVQGAMQMVFGVIETWIREHPEQWMWIHRIVR